MEVLGQSSRAGKFLKKFSLQKVVVAYTDCVGTKVCANLQTPNSGSIPMGSESV